MRWIARILSLLIALFYLSLWLFNDDVRSQPALPIIFQGLLTIVLLAAWRWERTAGRLAMIGGLVFFVMVISGALLRFDMPLLPALLASAALALPYVILGWFFFKISRPMEPTGVARVD